MNSEKMIRNDTLLKASKMTLKQLGLASIFIFGVIVIMIIFYLLYLTAEFLVETLRYYHWVGLIAVTSVVILFSINLFHVFYEELQLKSWKNNSGERPPFKKVSVKYASGKIQDAIDPSDVGWDLGIDDPVIQYKKYKQI